MADEKFKIGLSFRTQKEMDIFLEGIRLKAVEDFKRIKIRELSDKKKEVKIEKLTKPNAKLLLMAIDRYNTKCDNCDELLTENNFGLIHPDAMVCNSLLCITWALETIEEKGK